MLKIRIDDFPQTKGEPQHTLAAFREFHRELSALIGGKRYLLGVIPKRCSVEDVLFLRNETDCVIGMHGIHHDERLLDSYQNEFPSYLTTRGIGERLMQAAAALDEGVGRPAPIYMPPRNRIDQRTVDCLIECGFFHFTAGPETDRQVIDRNREMAIVSMPPYEYGRSDELLQREAHLRIMEKSDLGHEVVLTLHWTWETNIGLHHMRSFLSAIPQRYFEDFDA